MLISALIHTHEVPASHLEYAIASWVIVAIAAAAWHKVFK